MTTNITPIDKDTMTTHATPNSSDTTATHATSTNHDTLASRATSSIKSVITLPTKGVVSENLELRDNKIYLKSYKQYWRKRYKKGKEPSAENSGRTPRTLTPFEQAGNNIMITIKTTQSYHTKRVQVLLDTWISVVNASNVFLVTDGDDEEYETKARNIGKS